MNPDQVFPRYPDKISGFPYISGSSGHGYGMGFFLKTDPDTDPDN